MALDHVDGVDSKRRMLVAAVLLAVAGVVVVLIAHGFGVTVDHGDQRAHVGLFQVSEPTGWSLGVCAAVSIACLVFFRMSISRWWMRGALMFAIAAILLERRSLASSAREVEQYLRVEGSTAGVSNPITRAVSGPIDRIDASSCLTLLAVAALLFVLAAAASFAPEPVAHRSMPKSTAG